MFGYLRQSTATQSRMVGPFIDDTDFKTPETSLTIANTDVKLSKNGGVGVNKNSGGGTHRNNGMYSLTFDATDTDTVGELEGSILASGALLVVFKFVVVEETVYDALYASGAAGYSTFNPATDTVANVTTVATTTTNTDMRGTDNASTHSAADAAAAVDASVIEGTITRVQAERAGLSADAGKLSGAATTNIKIRNTGDTKDRIDATVDADGNRSAVTLDLT